MQTCTGAIWGRRRGVADGLTPGSMVISLTLGILKGEGPDAAASAGRFVSLAPDAFESENLLIAPNPCSVGGLGGSFPDAKTQLRATHGCACGSEASTPARAQ